MAENWLMWGCGGGAACDRDIVRSKVLFRIRFVWWGDSEAVDHVIGSWCCRSLFCVTCGGCQMTSFQSVLIPPVLPPRLIYLRSLFSCAISPQTLFIILRSGSGTGRVRGVVFVPILSWKGAESIDSSLVSILPFSPVNSDIKRCFYKPPRADKLTPRKF